jgi:uncharacterized protein (DUF2062 family)
MSFHRKTADLIVSLLRQGLTPERIALCLALGVIIGCFPISFGAATVLATIAAISLRLNLPAIQLANYAAAPLQIALFIPFMRIGEFLTRAKPLPLSLAQILALLKANLWGTVIQLWSSIMHAVAGWLVAGPLFAALLYAILLPLLRRVRFLPIAPVAASGAADAEANRIGAPESSR